MTASLEASDSGRPIGAGLAALPAAGHRWGASWPPAVGADAGDFRRRFALCSRPPGRGAAGSDSSDWEVPCQRISSGCRSRGYEAAGMPVCQAPRQAPSHDSLALSHGAQCRPSASATTGQCSWPCNLEGVIGRVRPPSACYSTHQQ